MWLWSYNQKRGIGKTFQTPAPSSPEQKDWDAWIEAKVNYERWKAQLAADKENAARGFAVSPRQGVPAPGPMPEGLYLLVGDAPAMASAVVPKIHTVRFDDGFSIDLEDNAAVPARYAYYRSANGVRSFGTPIKKLDTDDLRKVFSAAGVDVSAQRIFKAVSLLEGGFDSINTYDTGYVSSGFIQFACLGTGTGSLGAVLSTMKRNTPTEFQRDFRRFGVDVTADGALEALDLATGDTKVGFDAARAIIADKRLAAVFTRAGKNSFAFQVAQVKVANEQYFPASQLVSVEFDGELTTVKVGDFIKSEAGLATLMDRRVNTGKLGSLGYVASQIATTYSLKSADELAAYEYDIVKAMRYRKDYLSESGITQPKKSPAKQARGSSSKGRSQLSKACGGKP